jgi:hypothetical protein
MILNINIMVKAIVDLDKEANRILKDQNKWKQ